jgi:hypothetical protein
MTAASLVTPGLMISMMTLRDWIHHSQVNAGAHQDDNVGELADAGGLSISIMTHSG